MVKNQSHTIYDAPDFEIKNFISTFASEDRHEGFSAFMENMVKIIPIIYLHFAIGTLY